jgi:predicted metal-dependent peptidase
MKFAEKIVVAQRLQKLHYAFRVFWDMAEISFSDEIDRVCVSWNPINYEPSLIINEGFWRKLDDNSQLFLIMHECFHVLFNHVHRFSEAMRNGEQEIVNTGTDIVINEMLTEDFGFDREKLHNSLYNKEDWDNSGCWIDTVFRDLANKVEKNKSSDYYIDQLRLLYPNEDAASALSNMGFDEHEIMSKEDAENLAEALDQSGFMEMLGREVKEKFLKSEESKELESKGQLAGTGTGNWLTVKVPKVNLKQKWETVVRNFSKQLLRTDAKLEERWDRVKPLYSQIMKSGNMKLPFDSWVIGQTSDEKKGLIYMFLDCSGSCISLKDRFFKAAMTVDPRKIDLRLFSFDTSVHELDIKKKKVNGGGGTDFEPMERKIQQIMADKKTKYPDQVFVVTDGYGDSFRPEKPDRWIWFLTDNCCKSYIPKESKIFKLKDFE